MKRKRTSRRARASSPVLDRLVDIHEHLLSSATRQQTETSDLREVLRRFEQRLNRFTEVTRLCLVWGNGFVTSGGSNPAKPRKVTFACDPVWLHEGEREKVWIQSFAPVESVVLHVESPFVIRDVHVGNMSQFASTGGAVRVIECGDVWSVGNMLSVDVEWPKNPDRVSP
jgi:hypothetical protein